jgi:hypothetical protein
MTKKEIQDYKDKRNLKYGFNTYWNKGFEEAITLLNKQEVAINYTRCSLQLKGKYTQNFQDYVDKFFKYRPKVYEWVSKDGKREFTHKQLCKYYEKAMNESPLIV